MLGADDMPDDNADLVRVVVNFARLDSDTPESCPVAVEELLRYLADEVPGGERLTAGELRFLRTAQVGERRYWIWSFCEPDGGEPAFATVAVVPEGVTTLGYDANYYGLTPEQFMLADYHGVL